MRGPSKSTKAIWVYRDSLVLDTSWEGFAVTTWEVCCRWKTVMHQLKKVVHRYLQCYEDNFALFYDPDRDQWVWGLKFIAVVDVKPD